MQIATTTYDLGSLRIPYVPCGTIGFIKYDGAVRQVKCVGFHTEVLEYDDDFCYLAHEWRIAGKKGTFNGYPTSVLDCKIHNTADGAQFQNDELKSRSFNLKEHIDKCYRKRSDNDIFFKNGRFLAIRLYGRQENGSVFQTSIGAKFNITCTPKGMSISFPKVDDGTYFLTEDDARNSVKMLDVITFDDEDDL